jgi:rhodanese-related sulfurtransferase
MKIFKKLLIASTIVGVCATASFAGDTMISNGVKSIDMNLNGEKFTIMRNQTPGNKISSLYDTTNRGMPQPMSLAKGLETVGELEFINYMNRAQTDEKIVIIDSRTPGWYAKLRIPGAINIPYTNFKTKDGAIEAMEYEMGVVTKDNGKLDFTNAKTIVVYCNGYWCGQTPAMVKNVEYSLLNMGYPAAKIKYYRGGMQAWTSLGFTVFGSAK